MSRGNVPTTCVVWKFALPIADESWIEMPEGARILHVGVQNEQPWIWALCTPTNRKSSRRICVRGTGHDLGDASGEYLGTVMLADGAFVGHVFGRRN
jgi:hypothetical protein